MSEKITKLTTAEKVHLEKLYQKSRKQVLVNTLAVAATLLLFSVIPTGILSFFSSSDTPRSNTNPKLSIMQDLGFGAWLIVFLVSVVLLAWAYIASKKIFKLKKDLQDEEKIEVDVVVSKKIIDNETKNYSILVTGGSLKNQRITLTPEQVNQYAEGQNMRIEVYRNSRILIK